MAIAPVTKQFEAPVFEVITPMTKRSFLIRSLTVGQEESLKGSALATSTQMVSAINNILYECIQNSDKGSFDEFCRSITLSDREALMYGLLVASYGDEQRFNLQCGNCGEEFKEKISLSNAFKIKFWEGNKSVLETQIEQTLPVSNWKVEIGVPTVYDEFALMKSQGLSTAVISKMDFYMIVKKLIYITVQPGKDGVEKEIPSELKSIVDIYSKVKQLYAKDRKVIKDTWQDNFADYTVSVKEDKACPACGTPTSVEVNFLRELFRLSQ